MFRTAVLTLALAAGVLGPLATAAPAEAAIRIEIPAPVLVIGGNGDNHGHDRYVRERAMQARREERQEARRREEARERAIAYERREDRHAERGDRRFAAAPVYYQPPYGHRDRR